MFKSTAASHNVESDLNIKDKQHKIQELWVYIK